MKKTMIFCLCALLSLGGLWGCASEEAGTPPKGDFSFSLPEGYTLSDVTDTGCEILRDEDEAPVGGMETTTLKYEDLKGSSTDNMMRYLQEEFHQTNNVEYIASFWGNEHPLISVSLRRHGEAGEQKEFSHLFFEKDGCVYHMWFDMDVMDMEEEDRFHALTGVD